jgi:hypothetical protein
MTIDPAILERVKRCIGPLEDALDEAAKNPSPQALESLRQAADQVMRALAGILIELGQVKDSTTSRPP